MTKRKPRRGGRRRFAQKRDRKLGTKDKGLVALLVHMLQLMLQTAHRVRMLQGVATEVVLMPVDSPIGQAMEQEGEDFSRQVASLRDKAKSGGEEQLGVVGVEAAEEARKALRELGPPSDSTFAAMIDALAVSNIGNLNQERMKEVQQMLQASPLEGVRLCKLESCHESTGLIKIVLAFSPDVEAQRIKTTILASLVQLKGDVRKGIAPMGFLEDELAEWLEVLK